ncbi:MAG: histone H1-like protein [Caudoviricetes sp.]|nr:MAG: histone H1-like protein [Caudoviricetes sp.]
MQLYGFRNVLNGKDIINHFKKQGVQNLVKPNSLHLTIIYSKKDVNEKEIILDSNKLFYIPENINLQKFGDYLVMVVSTPVLQQRFDYFKSKGCSWDYDIYQPHISICENFEGDIDNLKPYPNPIELGKEKIEKLQHEWKEEDNLDI